MAGITLLLLCLSVLFRAEAEDNDTNCLISVKAALEAGEASQKLSNWNQASVTKPCSDPSSNSLEGVTCSNSRVISITLSSSNLAGNISPDIADCSDLQTLDLSSNSISGPIPDSIGNLTNLVTLNLSSNSLSGTIPVGLSACQYLNVLDLHKNKLLGSIPGELGLLTRLKTLDLSYNKLTGQIPSSLSITATGAPRFNTSSFEGNKDLHGYPLVEHSNHGLSVLAIVGIGLGSGLLSLLVSSFAVCIWLRVSQQGYAAQEGKISQLVSDT
ncbi:hypothetical protein KP509_31G060800 [Ceratopteris richardii]|uniref:Uncharacterized protein n=1 Tax=Ceratopteris richardii TaxID=49495 RepID=A0A8T2QYS9_CERRI|nr:hypothetical protein KP509_31G060800 [Ceratopteris richardii]